MYAAWSVHPRCVLSLPRQTSKSAQTDRYSVRVWHQYVEIAGQKIRCMYVHFRSDVCVYVHFRSDVYVYVRFRSDVSTCTSDQTCVYVHFRSDVCVYVHYRF